MSGHADADDTVLTLLEVADGLFACLLELCASMNIAGLHVTQMHMAKMQLSSQEEFDSLMLQPLECSQHTDSVLSSLFDSRANKLKAKICSTDAEAL